MPTITRLDQALRARGIPLGTFAFQAGIPRTTVRRLLAGETSSAPRRARLVETAQKLEVHVEEPWALVEEAAERDVRARGSESPLSDPPPLGSRPTAARRSRAFQPPEEETVIPTRQSLEEEDLQHFGFQCDPFAPLKPKDTWVSLRARRLNVQLAQIIDRKEIGAIVAGVGLGKSTALRRLHFEMQGTAARIRWMSPGNLDRRQITEGSLASALLRDLGLGDFSSSSSEQRGELLRRSLEEKAAEGELPVLVIDEAHDLSIDGLIAIKRLWDSFTFDRSLAVILAGQPTLKARLEGDKRLSEVAGRTRVLVIPPLTIDEAREYLDYRLKRAGVAFDKVIEPDALKALVERCPGQSPGPLWLDALTIAALRYARLLGSRTVTPALATRS